MLFAYCAQWGELADVHIMTGKNYGFVTFINPADAQSFLDIRDHTVNGRHVDAKAAVPRDQGGGRMTKKMFVGGVVDVSDEDFRDYFSQFGEIENASVIRKQDGTSRGYGFVTFKDEVSVEKCLVQEHYFNGKAVDCKRAVARDQQGGRGDGGHPHPGGLSTNPAMMMNPAAAAALMMNPAAAAAMMNSGAGMGMMFPMNPFMMGGGGGGGGSRGAGGGSGGGERQDRPRHPEWTCSECGNTNFAWRQACNKCKRARSGGAGMSADGDGDFTGGMGGEGMMGMMGGMNPFAFGMPGVAGAGMQGMPGMNMMGGGMSAPVMNPNMMGMMGGQAGMDPSIAASMMGTGTYGRAGGRGAGNNNANNSQSRFRPY